MAVDDTVRAKVFEEVYTLVSSDKINSNSAKALLEEVLVSDGSANITELAESKGFMQESDSSVLEAIVDQVIEDNPGPVEEIKNGETKVIGFLVGQIMKQSRGKANPAVAQKIIRKKLGV
jgi:aspartyl-tRNA(Asn)/glutamyl-tRNA(Gln) amidotransferase subunit B